MSAVDLLVVSNGHGEDGIGAALVAELRRRLPALRVQVLPLVGTGAAYAQADVVGPRRALPAGGLTLHHPSLLWRDLRAGLIDLTVSQLLFLRRQRPGAVLVVGDAYAQALAALVPAPRAVLQPLVSVLQDRKPSAARLNRYFMESIRAPERLLLAAAERVYTRDRATADALRDRGVRRATFLGNPVMDALAAPPLVAREDGRLVVALLPGTREYGHVSVAIMLRAVARLADGARGSAPVLALVAWALGAPPAVAPGWRVDGGAQPRWVRSGAEVRWVDGAFAAVLASADVVIGTSGTANEQAAGLGLPVVAFPVPPSYGRAFLENQERLLGGALRVVTPPGGSASTGDDAHVTALAAAVRAAAVEGPHRAAARAVGPRRMGGPGGTAALADDLAAWLVGRGEGETTAP